MELTTYEQALFSELSERDKAKYLKIRAKFCGYHALTLLFLEGSVSREKRDEIASLTDVVNDLS